MNLQYDNPTPGILQTRYGHDYFSLYALCRKTLEKNDTEGFTFGARWGDALEVKRIVDILDNDIENYPNHELDYRLEGPIVDMDKYPNFDINDPNTYPMDSAANIALRVVKRRKY